MTKILIVGAGSIGTALAVLLARNGFDVWLWDRSKEVVNSINKLHENTRYYPGIKLPDNIVATSSMDIVKSAEVIFLAVPSHATREVARKLKKAGLRKSTIIINLAKGIEYPPLKRLSQVIWEETKNKSIIVMSGPNFADEILLGYPSGTTIAGYNYEAVLRVKSLLENDHFIVQVSNDVIGVEMGGVLKNIYAIAMGICSALGINENAYFFILSEAFLEMRDIIIKMGGYESSLFLSSGFGDLCLTSSSNKSRNRILGFLAGKKMLGVVNNISVVFEGKKSVKAIREFCHTKNIPCPVIDFVYSVLIERIQPYKAFKELWKNIARRFSQVQVTSSVARI